MKTIEFRVVKEISNGLFVYSVEVKKESFFGLYEEWEDALGDYTLGMLNRSWKKSEENALKEFFNNREYLKQEYIRHSDIELINKQ